MTLPLFRRRPASFRHGVHPSDWKAPTRAQPIERVAFVDEYVLPLSQHIGAPAQAIVRKGQRVERGQMIARPGAFVSTALHSPVTGEVRALEVRAHPSGMPSESIVIAADPMSSQAELQRADVPAADAPARAWIDAIAHAGLVGLGGAAFPLHVKLAVPEGKRVEFLIINGCECEPYLTCDHRVMLERADEVLRGIATARRLTGADRVYIGIEINKSDAVEILRERSRDLDYVEVVPLAVKYPEGAEKLLIEATLGIEVPNGKIPLDLEIVVSNVGTMAALADLSEKGSPLIERVMTVTGPGIERPANLLVPLGTPLRAIVEHCGGLSPETQHLVLGGPMMGMSQKSLDVPVIKGSSGVLALTEAIGTVREQPCIRCGRCVSACPMFLNPSRLSMLARAERGSELQSQHMLSCFECASCSFVCPSHIPLVQWMRVGKSLVRQLETP